MLCYGTSDDLNLPHAARRFGAASIGDLRAEATRNRKAQTTSRFRGVIWAANVGRWRARIRVDEELLHLGLFEEEEDAARAYDRAARKAFGKRARLNLQ